MLGEYPSPDTHMFPIPTAKITCVQYGGGRDGKEGGDWKREGSGIKRSSKITGGQSPHANFDNWKIVPMFWP